ncbi:effector-associated constant component EACC1 [Kitasatospora sp. NPDC004272]
MTDYTIAFHGEDDEVREAAEALQQHLNRDAELRGLTNNRIRPPRPDEQGGIADAVQYAAELGPLVISPLCVWLEARLRKNTVSLELRRPDGTELRISTDSTRDSSELLDQVEEFLSAE